MASPRKFSEKIAQLAQRQAEGNAAFLQIMDDVKSAKSKPYPRQALHPAPPYARSLPNVNQITAAPTNNIQIQFGDYQGLGGVDARPDVGGPCRPRGEKKCGGMSPASSRHSMRTVGVGGGSGTNLSWQSPYSRTTAESSSTSAIPVSVVTSIASTQGVSVTVERVPPASQPFLSPPPFSEPWKRTYSDSALHTSVVGPNSPFMTHESIAHSCLNDGTSCSPHQNHSSSASASPSPPSPSCHQHPGYESPGSISIPCHATQSPLVYDPDGDETRTVRILRRESPQLMGMVQSVGCGADDPMKLMPDSSTSPSGSLPDLNAMHIPPPLPTPLDVDHTPVFRATVANIDHSRKFSQPIDNGSIDHQMGVPHSPAGMSNYEPGSVMSPDLFSTHPNFSQYRAPSDTSETDCRPLDYFSVWGLRSVGPPTSPIPIPKVPGHDQIPFSCNQRSSSPGCDPHSAPASPSDSSPLPGQRAVFVSELMSPVQHVNVDAYSMPTSSPTQTQHVLRQFQRINMVDSSTGTPVSSVQPALVTSTVSSIVPNANANGAVEVTLSEEYSRLLQEAVNEAPSAAHQQLSSNHGIVITLTAPDSSEPLGAGLGVSPSGLDSVSDLPQDLSDIFGIEDYGATDDDLRADLVPIDVDGFQLLMNPENNITDAATEDHFRMDRL